MTDQIKAMLDRADYVNIVYSPEHDRYMFQAFVNDPGTSGKPLIGGGELSCLFEYLQLLNK